MADVTPKRVLERRIKQRKLPSIEVPKTGQDEVDRALQGIAEHLRMYEGSSNAPKERFVSLEELEASGIVQLSTARGFASIAGVFGEPVQRVSSTKTSVSPRATVASSGASNLNIPKNWADLDDVDTPTVEKGSIAYFTGDTWTDSESNVLYDPQDKVFQFEDAHSINWVDSLSVSREYLDFTDLSGPTTLTMDTYARNAMAYISTTTPLTSAGSGTSAIQSLFNAGVLTDGDDYLVLARLGMISAGTLPRSWSQQGNQANVIKYTYGATVGASTSFSEAAGNSVSEGFNFSAWFQITADATSTLDIEVSVYDFPGSFMGINSATAYAMNLTELGATNWHTGNSGSIGVTSSSYSDTTAVLDGFDGVSDYVVFYNITAQTDSRFTRVDVAVTGGMFGATDLHLYEFSATHSYHSLNTSWDNRHQMGMFVLEAPANDEITFRAKRTTSSSGPFINGTIDWIAIRLDAFAQHYVSSTADPVDPSSSGAFTRETINFTSTGIDGTEFGILGGVHNYYPGSGFGATSEVQADVNSGGAANVSGSLDVKDDGNDTGDSQSAFSAVFPVGSGVSAENPDPITWDLDDEIELTLQITAAPSSGGNEWRASGLAVFSTTLAAVGQFTVGNAETSTLIHGSSVKVDTTLNVTGAVDLDSTLNVDGASTFVGAVNAQAAVDFDSTLNVDGVADFNANVEINNASLIIYDSTGADSLDMSHDDTDFQFAFTQTADVTFAGATSYSFDDSVFITESSDDNADVAAKGQFWVQDYVPNSPRFTNDAGAKFALNNILETDFTYSDTVTATDPTAGKIQFDSVTIGSITEMYIDDLAAPGQDYGWVLSNLAADDILVIKSESDDADYIIAAVTSAPTDNTGWWTIPLTLLHTGTIFSDTDQLRLGIEWQSSLGTTLTFNDLADAEDAGRTTNDMMFWDGTNWTDTDGKITWDGNILTILDAGKTDSLAMSHDGTDFNFAFTATTNWNITGITAIAAGAVDADFDAITATSYGGILEANLLSRIADETVTGAYSFQNATGLTVLDAGGTDSITLRHDGTFAYMDFVTTAAFKIGTGIGGAGSIWIDADTNLLIDGGIMTIQDSGGTATAFWVHDGTDFNFDFTNTTDWNIDDLTAINLFDGVVLEIYDGGNSDKGAFSHDGTDFNFDFTNTTALNITGATSIEYTESVTGNLHFQMVNSSVADGDRVRLTMFTDTGVNNFAIFAQGAATTSAAVTGGPTGATAAIRTFGVTPMSIATNNIEAMRFLGDGTIETRFLFTTVATATGSAGFNLPHGTAPSAPVDGDVWTTTASLFGRINGVTIDFGSGSGDAVLANNETILGEWTVSATSFNFLDGVPLIFGTGDDVELDVNTSDFDINSALNVDVRFQEAGVNKFIVDHTNDRINIKDGYTLRVSDPGDTDFTDLSHDGTDAAFTFTNTGDVNFSGITGAYLFDNTIRINAALPTFKLFENDQAADEGMWDFAVSGGDIALRSRTDADTAGISPLTFIRGTGTAVTSADFLTEVKLITGSKLTFYDSSDVDNLSMYSDGTDFFIEDNSGHAHLKFLSLQLYLSAATPTIHFYETDQAVDEKMWDVASNSADFEVRTRTDADGAGISALEIKRGTGTAVAAAVVRATALQVRNQSTDSVVFTASVTDSNVWVRDGFKLKISDSADTDFVEGYHDGSDFNWDYTNTSVVNHTGAVRHIFDGDIEVPYLRTSVTTTTALEDITDAINTDPGKRNGSMVWNNTTNMYVVANSNSDGAVWKDPTGATAHTPV